MIEQLDKWDSAFKKLRETIIFVFVLKKNHFFVEQCYIKLLLCIIRIDYCLIL